MDRPVSVETLTGTVAEEVRGRAGTVAWQVVSLGQATGAWAGPKVTVMWPSELKKPLPRRVTRWPAAPEPGEISTSTGLGPGFALGGLEVGGLEVGGLEVGGLEVGGLEVGGLEVGDLDGTDEDVPPGAEPRTDVVEVGDLAPAGCADPRDATRPPLRTNETPSPAPASRSSTTSTSTARVRRWEEGGRPGVLPLPSRGRARHATPIAPTASANAMTAIAIATVQLLTASMARGGP